MWVNISYRIFFLTCSNPSFQVPLSLLSFLSGQKFQRAGVRLEHEDLQNIIRFLLLTFRYLSSYLCYSEFGQLKFHNWWVSSLLDQGLHVHIFVQFDVFASFKRHNYLKKHIVVQCCTAKFVSPGQLGRATSLGMTSCPDWKKAATSGPKLPFRRCTSRGVNMVHWFVLSRRSRPCSASARYVQIKYIEEISPIFKYFLMTRTKNLSIFKPPRLTSLPFCSVFQVSGHAVEAWHGSELWHMPISQLPICVSTAEVHWAFWTDLSEVFWDDHSTVPGLYLFMWM